MKVLIAGDFSPRACGVEVINKKEYEGKFEGIRELTKKSDFSILNFETNISTSNCSPIRKHGPNLTTIPQSLDFIKYLGFNVVTLANNHFYDYGEIAVDNTLKILDDKNVKHVGGGRNIKEAGKILYLKKDKEILAVINACEHEFSIADEDRGGSNPLNVISIYHSIIDAKKYADYILCIIHGGHEHFQFPSLRMQEWYRFFIDIGADVVVNHHQHCYSGMEIYKGKPIYYGLGNFLFDCVEQKSISLWNEGILVDIDFSDKLIETSVIPYIQCFNDFSIDFDVDGSTFKSKFNELNRVISNRKVLALNNKEFYLEKSKNYTNIFEPYIGRFLRSAYWHGLLPSFITEKRKFSIRNYIECESHLDALREVIQSLIK